MVRRHDTRRPDPRRSANRGLGLGAELAAALVGFVLFGLWIDHTYDSSPWGVVVCSIIGLVGGFYNFLRSSLRILRSPAASAPRRAPDAERSGTGGRKASEDKATKDSSPDRRNQIEGDDEPPARPAHRRDPAD